MPRILLGILACLLLPTAAGAPDEAAAPRSPVLIELFTSEGCSSCPPADEYVAQLVRTQPLQDVKIIALSEHVDYWNSLGWKDPFSSAEFTHRQRRYARQLGSGVYTPQVVIDGSVDHVGNQRDEVLGAIFRAGKRPKADLRLSAGWSDEGDIDVHVELVGDPEQSNGPFLLWTAVAEDGLVVAVPRGENGGRDLHHDGVARRLGERGKIRAGQTRDLTIEPHRDWNRNALRVVAFLENPADGRIVGVAEVKLSPIDPER